MKINAVITKKPSFQKPVSKLITKPNLTDSFNKSLIAITAVIGFGVVFGGLLFMFDRQLFLNELWNHYVSFKTDVEAKSFVETFSGFLLSELLFYAILSILGTSAVGSFLIYPLIFLKGAGIGALASFFVQSFSLDGVGYYFLSVFPGKTVFMLALLILSQNCIQTSGRIRKSLKNGSEVVDLKLYALRTAIAVVIFALGSLIDSATIRAFSSMFNLSL